MDSSHLDSPASPLASFVRESKRQPALILLTGPSLAGKTACCLALARWAGSLGLEVGGLASPAVLKYGRRTAIDLLDLSSGRKKRLAEEWDAETRVVRTRLDEGEELVVGGWRFDPAVLAWGNEVLAALGRPDWLILDELGPLEFDRKAGLQEGLRLVDEGRARLSWVVVRPRLLEPANARWPWAQVIDVAQFPLAVLPGEAGR